MPSLKLTVVLAVLFFMGGCCMPMHLLHDNGPRHHSSGHPSPPAGARDPNAPQEYIMQEQPSAAPAQPSAPASGQDKNAPH
jgi:hypothetical protein